MFVQCPFYGFHWPERHPELIQVGGNACGLELDTGKACQMESSGRDVNYNYCPVALRWKPILDIARREIRFRTTGVADAPSLDDWVRGIMKKGRAGAD
jgi:hypothetical protein